MTTPDMSHVHQDISDQKRLVLCFDGTGNKFLGDESDTNIVKLYQMLDRACPNQYHYYQPGIGTYVDNQHSLQTSPGLWAKMKGNVASAVDQAVGTTFASHVIAGYSFIMRYYSPGDAIYIFGFSRGAYTARFLAEMLHSIGLLSRGNEEMIHHAWETFSAFQQARGKNPPSSADQARIDFMVKFKQTFCREGCQVHFLGLFDCVNSVGQFEIPFNRKSYKYIATPPATHIRHAVSIHERRLKFKPALFQQEGLDTGKDLKEVWFAGNHADVGGGWPLLPGQHRLLSDTPLAWMVQEILELPDTPNPLAFQRTDVKWTRDLQRNPQNVKALAVETPALNNKQKRQLFMKPHDMLRYGGGVGWFGTFCWWIIEVLPIFTRLELEHGEWVPRYWPPNMGARRDIPLKANIHPSVKHLHRAGVITTEELPQLGGDHDRAQSKIFASSRVLSQWSALRKSKSSAKDIKAHKSNGVNGESSENLLPAKKWGEMGSLGAKRWSFD